MRSYQNMIEDYLEWYSVKTNDESFLPINYFSCEERELKIRKARVWQTILDLSYKKEGGIYWFKKFILGDLTEAGYPEPLVFNNLWWDWTKLSRKGSHLMIKCPRQHGKSTYWTVLQPLYRSTLFSHYDTLITSASEDQAIKFLSKIMNIIETNEFLTSKRSKNAKWSTTEIVYNGGKIIAKGVGAEVRGGTYDYIVCDDVLRSDNKLSDSDIEDFVDEELEPMLFVRNGQLVIVGTPKSATDIFNTIEDRINAGEADWIYKMYQAIINYETEEILCPTRFTFAKLMQIRKRQGQRKFDKEFMCTTYSSGTQLFQDALIKHAKKIGENHIMYSSAKSIDAHNWVYYLGVDCARAGTAGGDYTVVIVLAYNPTTQDKKVIWMWREKGLKIVEQVKQIAEISRKFNNPAILVEKNNIGQEFIDMLVDNYNLNVESFTTTKTNKEDLIRFLIGAFENEKILLPTGDEFSREQTALIELELSRFVVEITPAGNEKMKGSGRSHDDIVMSLALANRCSQAYGYVPCAVTSGDRKTTSLERFAAEGDITEILRF